jgi:hypothetical protein
VLLAGERKHADDMKAWSDSLHRHLAGDSATVQWFMVADLRSVPRLMLRLANQRAPRERHRRLLFDREGSIARQLRLGRDTFTVVVLSPTGEVKLRLAGIAADSPPVQTVRRMVAPP